MVKQSLLLFGCLASCLFAYQSTSLEVPDQFTLQTITYTQQSDGSWLAHDISRDPNASPGTPTYLNRLLVKFPNQPNPWGLDMCNQRPVRLEGHSAVADGSYIGFGWSLLEYPSDTDGRVAANLLMSGRSDDAPIIQFDAQVKHYASRADAARQLGENPCVPDDSDNVTAALAQSNLQAGNAPNDALYSRQSNLENNTANCGLNGNEFEHRVDVDIQNLWNLVAGSDHQAIVAVVDGGFYLDHEDLGGTFWTNPGEIAGNNHDDDGNGFIDDANGFHFGIDQCNGDISTTGSHHGTSIAGIIAARTGNGRGIAGITRQPNGRQSAVIMPINTPETGVGQDGTLATYYQAIYYAVVNGADLINASWGFFDDFPMVRDIHEIIDETTNILFVCAVGNEPDTFDDIDFPARYPSTVAVQAINCNGTFYECTSQRGPEVDIAAHYSVWSPKTSIDAGTGGFCTSENNCYETFGGTSSAAPQVTATAAMMLAANPYLSRTQLLRLLRTSALKVGGVQKVGQPMLGANYEASTGKDDYLGFGVLNAYVATFEAADQPGIGNVHWDLTGTGNQVDRGEEVGISWEQVRLNSSHTLTVEAVDQMGNTYPIFQQVPALAPGVRFTVPQSWPDNRQYMVRLKHDQIGSVIAFSKVALNLPEQDWIDITYQEDYCDNWSKPLTWETSYSESEHIRLHVSVGSCSASAILPNTGNAEIEVVWLDELLRGQSGSNPSCGGVLDYQVYLSSVSETHVQTRTQYWTFRTVNVQDCRGNDAVE